MDTDVRESKVATARAKIESGTAENRIALDIAMERLLDEFEKDKEFMERYRRCRLGHE